MTVTIEIRNRQRLVQAIALVDDDDARLAEPFRWSLGSGYAMRKTRDANGTSHTIFLHREVLGLTLHDGQVADHINGDRLDNRRQNLRIVPWQGNCQNQTVVRAGTSRFRGVSFNKRDRNWVARCRLDGRLHYIGSFHDEEEAGRAAALFRAEHMPFSLDARSTKHRALRRRPGSQHVEGPRGG